MKPQPSSGNAHASVKSVRILACLLITLCGISGRADAAVIIDLANTTTVALFDGDMAGDTAGPFLDPTSNVSGTITSVVITDGTGTPGASLDFTSTQSGIDSTNITLAESWTFEWNVNSQFLAIDLSGLSAGLNAQIQSNAWIGASITPGSANVSFNSVTGTFQFNGSQAGDTFSTANMYGVSVIPVISAGTDITLSSVIGDPYSIGSGFTWNLTAVPEPATTALVGFALGCLALFRRRA